MVWFMVRSMFQRESSGAVCVVDVAGERKAGSFA